MITTPQKGKSNKVSALTFWENKILNWESGRYDSTKADKNIVENIANLASGSLRCRLEMSGSIIGQACKGKRVIELGCGSGRLAAEILDSGASSYVGFDISPSAIDAANDRIKLEGLDNRASFICSDTNSLEKLDCDIVFSVGLLDWLTDDQIVEIFKKSNGVDCLHSFSEARTHPAQLLHKFYVHITYGHKTGNYVPRYLSAAKMTNLLRAHCDKEVSIIRSPKLSFGVFLTTLPTKT